MRDIYITRLEGVEWRKPNLVHADNWIVDGCPDNGPAVDAIGKALAVAWWTASGNAPKVLVAFSKDAGDSFGRATRVDAAKGEGQVTIALLKHGDGAVVGWLEDGQVWARYVSASGNEGPSVALGRSPHHSRLPCWLEQNGSVLAAWTSSTEGRPHVEVSLLSVANLR